MTAAFGNSYGYDANGNQTSRTIGGAAYTFTFDYENRITEVKQGTTSIATFVYDANGNRVKGTVNGATIAYIGGVYEYHGGGEIRYYEGGVFLRGSFASNTGRFYQLRDHLGSSSVIVSHNGATSKREYYYPYGGNRGTAFSTWTTKRFTGQYHESGLPGGEGLSYYNARWYDAQLGRFVSADSVVPDPGSSQSLNRYMYTLGNPLRYVDPTGHYSDEVLYRHFGCGSWSCVEAQFQAGGVLAGQWGWLRVLMTAEDGDRVVAGNAGEFNNTQLSGQFVTIDGKITVQPTGLTHSSSEVSFSTEDFADDFSAEEFAAYGKGTVGWYRLQGEGRFVSTGYDQEFTDCRHTDCTERALNGVATTSAGVAVACGTSVVGNAGCTQGALGISGLAAGASIIRTGYKTFSGDSPILNLAVAATLVKSAAQSEPRISFGASALQWAWDEFISPHIPEGW